MCLQFGDSAERKEVALREDRGKPSTRLQQPGSRRASAFDSPVRTCLDDEVMLFADLAQRIVSTLRAGLCRRPVERSGDHRKGGMPVLEQMLCGDPTAPEIVDVDRVEPQGLEP